MWGIHVPKLSVGLINEQPKQFYNILTSILLIEYKTINHIGLSKHKQITEYLIINCYTTSYIISDYIINEYNLIEKQ